MFVTSYGVVFRDEKIFVVGITHKNLIMQTCLLNLPIETLGLPPGFPED